MLKMFPEFTNIQLLWSVTFDLLVFSWTSASGGVWTAEGAEGDQTKNSVQPWAAFVWFCFFSDSCFLSRLLWLCVALLFWCLCLAVVKHVIGFHRDVQYKHAAKCGSQFVLTRAEFNSEVDLGTRRERLVRRPWGWLKSSVFLDNFILHFFLFFAEKTRKSEPNRGLYRGD